MTVCPRLYDPTSRLGVAFTQTQALIDVLKISQQSNFGCPMSPNRPTTVLLAATATIASLLFLGCETGQAAKRLGWDSKAIPANEAATDPQVEQQANGTAGDIRIVISTTKGDIKATLYGSMVPMTVANFVNLAQQKYYDGILFHRVIPDFMAQVGDPLTRNPKMEHRWGTGGPGYEFADEIDPMLKHDRPGVLSMANSGPNTNGSQIFITHVPTPHLDGKHAVFGAVTDGMGIVWALKKGDKITQIRVLDDPTALLKSQAKFVEKWNAALKK